MGLRSTCDCVSVQLCERACTQCFIRALSNASYLLVVMNNMLPMFAVGPSIAFKRPAFVGRCFCGGLMWWYGDIAEWFPCRWFPSSYLLSVVPYCNLYFHGLASIFENICALALFNHSKSSWCILSCISQDCQVSYEPQVAVFDDCNNVFLYSGTSIQNE